MRDESTEKQVWTTPSLESFEMKYSASGGGEEEEGFDGPGSS